MHHLDRELEDSRQIYNFFYGIMCFGGVCTLKEYINFISIQDEHSVQILLPHFDIASIRKMRADFLCATLSYHCLFTKAGERENWPIDHKIKIIVEFHYDTIQAVQSSNYMNT